MILHIKLYKKKQTENDLKRAQRAFHKEVRGSFFLKLVEIENHIPMMITA